jgi:hypothetical protein
MLVGRGGKEVGKDKMGLCYGIGSGVKIYIKYTRLCNLLIFRRGVLIGYQYTRPHTNISLPPQRYF